jgi:hypothetical protein
VLGAEKDFHELARAMRLQLWKARTADVAILDINLNGQRIDPVAEALSNRNLPFTFASGYRGRSHRSLSRQASVTEAI